MNCLLRRVGFYLETNITSNTNVLPVIDIPKNLYRQKGTKYWYLKNYHITCYVMILRLSQIMLFEG